MINDWLTEYWSELYLSNLGWAFDAYERLISSMNHDIKKTLSMKGKQVDPFVVVFGKTQVGKTTLLLDLLGIHSDQISIVSHVLRGGREAGKSATATTMEYCRSTSEDWALTINSKKEFYAAESDMILALSDLRESMENETQSFNSPCIVDIPTRFFSIAAKKCANIRILDLPGDNPANATEQKHVYAMAKAYLPFADLILLVGRGDDLSFLNSEAMSFPGLENWQAMLGRFRIVTTFSYSAQSIRDLIRKKEEVNISDIRARLIEQIQRFGELSNEGKNQNLFYPLEFGNSWQNLEKQEPVLYRKLKPLINGLRTTLIDEIHASVSPVSRLRNMLDSHVRIEYIYKKKLERLKQDEKKIIKEIQAIDEDAQIYKKLNERELEQLNKKIKLIEYGTSENLKSNINDLIAVYKSECHYKIDRNPEKESVISLKRLILNYKSQLNEIELNLSQSLIVNNKAYWRDVEKTFTEPNPSVINNEVRSIFGQVEKDLDKYFIKKYLSIKNYHHDKNKVETARKKSEEFILLQWENSWIKAINTMNKKNNNKKRQLKASILINKDEQRKLQKESHIKNNVLSKLKIRVINTEKLMKEDITKFETFINILEQEYHALKTKKIDAFLDEDDECDAFMQLISFCELSAQRDTLKLLHGKK
ncbi:dynamin family protein [Pseudoalteromonas sp. SG41-1]|uniref:dynamin family protein n=1 Tax=Pseudoalteromonas sp. SG41-1 TaxID=2760979 RepID=UPI001604811E|nr:dynamin family protein [Pseudoalteromonas sp. SG41-1]MBB1504091.1 dynamin family protein [Pseudoalteromonas sp. SG41-1]